MCVLISSCEVYYSNLIQVISKILKCTYVTTCLTPDTNVSGADNDFAALTHAMKLLRWSSCPKFHPALLTIHFIDGTQNKSTLHSISHKRELCEVRLWSILSYNNRFSKMSAYSKGLWAVSMQDTLTIQWTILGVDVRQVQVEVDSLWGP